MMQSKIRVWAVNMSLTLALHVPCYIQDAINNTFERMPMIMLHDDDMLGYGLDGDGNARMFLAISEAFVLWGCCDHLLLQEIEYRAFKSLSPRALRMAAMALDYCELGEGAAERHLRAAETFQLAMDRHLSTVSCSTAWQPVPIRRAAKLVIKQDITERQFSHNRDLLHIVGEAFSLPTSFRDRAVQILRLVGIGLRVLWLSNLRLALPFDLDRCILYQSDKWPDESSTEVFRNDVLANSGHMSLLHPVLIMDNMASNYYHFMTEFVSKLHYFFLQAGQTSEFERQGAKLLLPDHLREEASFQEILQMLSIDRHVLWLPSRNLILNVSSVLSVSWEANRLQDFGSAVSSHDQVYFPPRIQVSALRTFLLNAVGKQPRELADALSSMTLQLIWVGRPASGRGLSRDFEIETLGHLSAQGHWRVQRFDGTGRSIREQASVFVDADVVFGVHGAGLTNLLFVPSHAACVFIPSIPETGFYLHFSAALQSSAHALLGGFWVLADGSTPYRASVHVHKWCLQMFEVFNNISLSLIGKASLVPKELCDKHDQGRAHAPCGLSCIPDYKIVMGCPDGKPLTSIETRKKVRSRAMKQWEGVIPDAHTYAWPA
eukprot:TRINITY_DN51655_c0_g1_i1.p1 TRINITY_DN51655_c0_g1~~TRINITY_DN51655_c0_g1_i1.p1  ORF type:complete len:604 (+),score=82.04 TRINITY_DN51655_c0_g1_i1:177-1988(+)